MSHTALIVVSVVLSIMAIFGIKIVPEANAFIVERFGRYCSTWRKGLHFKFPLIEKIRKKISLKEQIINLSGQSILTRDNAEIKLDAVIYFKVTYPKLYTYEIEQPINMLENLSFKTFHDIVKSLTLTDILPSRDSIASEVRMILNESVNDWGVSIVSVDIKEILLPGESRTGIIRRKDLNSNRERRTKILNELWGDSDLKTENHEEKNVNSDKKRNNIFVETILNEAAVSDVISNKKRGENFLNENKINTIVKEDKVDLIISPKYGKIDNRAETVYITSRAFTDTLTLLHTISPTDKVLANKVLDLLKAVADGRSTEHIIPSEL
ncbi:MAG: SPFH/Band 7/PHB domain protein [Oscillospiraceae bacterium]|jgi:hypothetical protein|nr:SPFH/Band 7/PHB domain protein [Oscillospiraceae bacterium]